MRDVFGPGGEIISLDGWAVTSTAELSLVVGWAARPISDGGAVVSYRNKKTYVAFASEDIHCYRLMEAWRDNDRIDFDFYDAHDLFISRDTSQPETIKRNLRERMKNAKQIVLLGSVTGRQKGSDGRSFLAHEVKVAIEFDLPIVIANLDGKRTVDLSVIPQPPARCGLLHDLCVVSAHYHQVRT